jgi:hypothetical protein
VDSSLWQEPYFVRVLFTSMLALKDRDFIVRPLDTFKLKTRAHMEEQEVIDGLAILMAPDKRRIGPQEFDGRRIEEVAGVGWKILNGPKYRDMVQAMKAESIRESKRLWQANDRKEQAYYNSLNDSEKAQYLKERGLEFSKRRKDGRPTKSEIKRAAQIAGGTQALAEGWKDSKPEPTLPPTETEKKDATFFKRVHLRGTKDQP